MKQGFRLIAKQGVLQWQKEGAFNKLESMEKKKTRTERTKSEKTTNTVMYFACGGIAVRRLLQQPAKCSGRFRHQ
jgi:hypothetical protein